MDRTQLEELLAVLVRSGGTTLHLMANHPPCLRINGALVAADEVPITSQIVEDLARDFLFEEHRLQLDGGQEIELSYSAQSGARFRTTVIPQVTGLSMVFRRLPEKVPTFEELELPELLSSFVSFRTGFVVITGFFGSGKNTTLAAMVDRVNRERPVNIVTLEDPIEYIHQPASALVHQRELGTHVGTVSEGIAHATRQGAEVIAASEIRDCDGLLAALDAAERGRLVLATFTASCVVGAVADLMRMVPSEIRNRVRYRVARSLRAMISQSLIRRRHAHGRVPLLEILVKNEAVAKAIQRGRLDMLPEIMARSRGLGMQTTDIALRILLQRHLISIEEAAYHAVDREWVCAARSGSVPETR